MNCLGNGPRGNCPWAIALGGNWPGGTCPGVIVLDGNCPGWVGVLSAGQSAKGKLSWNL